MESDKRKEFIQQIAYQINNAAINKFLNETKTTNDWEMADGYRSFISDLGEGFLEIAENYNMCIEIAKNNELIGDVKLKARIKDFSSSRLNTDTKILDDIFGIELVTPTETEKEILMLFNHLVFNISKDKKYNKPTGYIAYHCMADFAPKEDYIKEWIKRTVLKTKTREYKRTKKNDKEPKSKKNMVYIFPELQTKIKETTYLNEIVRSFREMIDYMELTDDSLDLPTIEFQFKTAEVAENAIRGTAAHTKYKNDNEKLIEDKFKSGNLIRGVNSPWKFDGTSEGLKLQDFYDTLLQNWPFLRKIIVQRRNEGQEEIDTEKTSVFDHLTATQFPFLREYISANYTYDDSKKEENWGKLKEVMVAHRIGGKEESIDKQIVSEYKS